MKAAFVLPLVLMFASMCFATGGDLGGASYDGTEAAPYQISDAEDLKAFAELVNKVKGGAQPDAWAVLTADIVLNEHVLTDADGNSNVCENGVPSGCFDGDYVGADSANFFKWTPMGAVSNPYAGTFDGNGKTIMGLYFENRRADSVGLFGSIGSNAKIQNVGVVDSYIKGRDYVGGIVGVNDEGSVSNSYNTGFVNGRNWVGGVVGISYSDGGVISNSYNTGSVRGSDSYVGGVVGYNGGSVSNVYNTGAVSGDAYVGGVVGQSCNTASVSNAYNTGAVSGSGISGGVVGENYNGIVSNAYNSGVVNGYNVGGVVGVNDGGSVSNVYNTGSVSGSDGYAGGVVGENRSGTVSNSYNTGSVSGDAYVGGVVGKIRSGAVSNSYYNTNFFDGNAIGVNSGTDENVVGKTSAELAELDVATAFAFAEGEANLWTPGDIIESMYELPYIADFGENAQPKYEIKIVTIKDAGGEVLGTLKLPGGCKLAFADVQVKEKYEVFSLYTDLADENTKWDFENDVVSKNVTLYFKSIGFVDGVYQIATAEDLKVFAAKVNSGDTSISAVLTADICLNACGKGQSVLNSDGTLNGDSTKFEQWIPIGTAPCPGCRDYYVGTFDGKDANGVAHTIRGLYINDTTDYAGLFAQIRGKAKVQNVGVVDSYIKGRDYVGGIVGVNDEGSVSNSYNTGFVNGRNWVGGVVGENYNGIVSNVYNTGSVSGSVRYVGGVVGRSNEGIVSNSYNSGTVSGGMNVGGIVGDGSRDSVSNVYNSGAVSGDDHVGGIVGDGSRVSVSNVYNTGIVSGGLRSSVIGSDFYSIWNNCYNNTDIINYSGPNTEGKTSAELASKGFVDNAFAFEEGEENPWHDGFVKTVKDSTTYFLPYLKVFGSESAPAISGSLVGRAAIGAINTSTVEFRFAPRHFDLKGRGLGDKKPSVKGSYYSKKEIAK